VTEIPEHLLKRAAARRAAMAGGETPAEGAPSAAPAETAPSSGTGAVAAVSKATTPKRPAPLPTLDDAEAAPPPDIAVVAAAKRRKRIPYWAAPVLALLPLWAFLYLYALQPPPAGANDALAVGKEIYSANCASCHLASGDGAKGGGVGQQLSDGHVLKTFADPLDQLHWIAFGAEGGARPNGTYGDPDRPGGAMNVNTLTGEMFAFGKTLSPEELAAVTIYVREGLSGGKPADDKKFNTETFAADPTAAADIAQKVIDLGEGGDPDTASVEGSESSR